MVYLFRLFMVVLSLWEYCILLELNRFDIDYVLNNAPGNALRYENAEKLARSPGPE